MDEKFPGAVFEIPVSNVDEAAAYYENCFGFRRIGVGRMVGLVKFPEETAESF